MEKIIQETKTKIIYQVDDKVLKTYGESFNVSQVLNEALNQSKVYEARVPTAKVYAVKKYNDRIAIEMDYIEGKMLSTYLEENAKDKDKYISLFAKIHHDLMNSSIANLNNSYGRIKNKIFNSELSATSKYALFYKMRKMEFSYDTIHGDYNLTNVIISNEDKPYIIDWSHVSFGNRKFDIATTYAIFVVEDKEDIANAYLEKICELENIDKKLVLDELILAYIYIVDRYAKNIQDKIYDKIYDIIRDEEV